MIKCTCKADGNAEITEACSMHMDWLKRQIAAHDRQFTQPFINNPPGEVNLTTNEEGGLVAVTRVDKEGRVLKVIWHK